MSHRFPIQEAVFPPLQLSESAKDKFVNTALMQLTRALRDYDKYQKWQASRPPSLRYQLHPAMWKPIKTCEQLTVYRRVPADDAVVTAPTGGSRRRARSRTLEAMRLAAATGADSVSSAPKESVTDSSWPGIPTRGSGLTSNSEWNMPTLLQVGTIEGTLNDVMYGLASFDAVGTLIKSSYTAEEVVDAETLYELQGPTPEEPFRFLGIKWVVKSTSSSVKAFRKLDSNAKPAWDYNSETEENDGDNGTVVSSNTVLLPLDSEPRKTRTRDTRARSNSRKTVTKQNLSKIDAEIPIVAHPDVWDVDSDTDYEVDYVVTSQTHPEVPILGDALPEAVVQYAWGAVVPSPTNKESSEAPAPWPSPPSSPLPSPTPLPKEKEDSWPTTQGERASVWTPPVSQPTTIPRIHAGASTQEVLAQFAELCNAAENVYQAARKHTITHLDTTVLPTRQNNTRLDMSAVD
ncbi:hypothetical protein JG687_00007592 [Phytophthora cactorum]|uniref:Uncharacterized protein n=1 Tax=Phytophthora cactorum TaxID=29920 RepID=A0A8T1UER0_9STRA|nr:hypothetical protein JG687_00007592 [Phytophthora cactorum]